MGKKIVTFLIYDDEYGPKVIEIGNWSGKAIYCPVNYLTELMESRKEYKQPGLYFLNGISSLEGYKNKIYVGEGENVGGRLKDHLLDPKKDFYECVIFISKDEMLTKAHIKYLESLSINLIKKFDNVELDNPNNSNLPTLHEADRDDMNYFFDQVKIILSTIGFDCFKENIIDNTDSFGSGMKIKEENTIIYYIKRSDFGAKMIIDDKGFVVLKGSKCKKEHNNSMAHDRIVFKNKLIKSGILKLENNEYVFTKDTIFNSVSQAASIILGAQTAGTLAWKDGNDNTYKENLARELNKYQLVVNKFIVF